MTSSDSFSSLTVLTTVAASVHTVGNLTSLPSRIEFIFVYVPYAMT